MTCKFCGSPLPDGAMICDLCGNNQKASKPVDAFSFGATPAPEKKGKPADRWNTGPSASMEGASMEEINPTPVKRKKSHGSFPVKKLLAVLGVLIVLGGLGFGAWWFINNRGVDENEEIVESFKKVIRAKNATFSATTSVSLMGQKKNQTMEGGFSYNKSDKLYVLWNKTEGVEVANVSTPDGAYQIEESSQRFYNLYLSNPEEFPNARIVMANDGTCYQVTTVEENNFKEMEDLFNGDLLDQIEKQEDDPQAIAEMSALEKQYYEAGKKLEKEFTDPDFIKDVLNAKRSKVGESIRYEFDADIAEILTRLYSSIGGLLPADQQQMVNEIKGKSKKDYEEMGVKLTGSMTITDGYFAIGIINYQMSTYGSIEIDLRVNNPGRTEIPDNIKQMVAAINLK